MSEFRLGQLVQVSEPRSLAYGRIAMVVLTIRLGRFQVRFADLPKDVASSDDPTGFVKVFDEDELIPITDVPIAACYGLITIYECNNGQESKHQVLVHGQPGQSLEAMAVAIAQNWHTSEEAGDVGTWDDRLEAFVFLENRSRTVAVKSCEEISLAEYIHLKRAVPDITPGEL